MSGARAPIAHGTERGWAAHRRRHEPVCEPCRVARARGRADRAATAAGWETRARTLIRGPRTGPLCAQDPDLFLLRAGTHAGQARAAQAVCLACPILAACAAQAATRAPEPSGHVRQVLGGRIWPTPPTPAHTGRAAACGTPSGARRHWAAGEKACAACAQANNDYQRTRYARLRAAAAGAGAGVS